MAEASMLVPAANGIVTLLSLVTKQIDNPIKPAWGFKEDLEKLRERFEIIQALLHDAEKKKIISQTMLVWLKKLKAAICDAENVLDEFAYEDLRRKIELQNRMRNKVMWADGCEMEFTKGSWSVAEDIGDLNSDQKKENVGICMLGPDGNHAVRRALNEFYAEPAEKSILTVVSPVLTGDSCFVLLWSPITIKGQCRFDIQVLNFCEKVRERQEQQEEEISMSAISESLQIPSTCCYTPLLG